MTADSPVTRGTLPLRLFLLKELFRAVRLDIIQVLDHAHVIFRAVALVQIFQSLTWISLTHIAEPDLAFTDQVTMIRHMRTIFASGNTAGAV